ncbi:MAG: glycosyltransferase [Acetobacteraceae bacterium]
MRFVLFTRAEGRSSRNLPGDIYATLLAEAVGADVVAITGRVPVPDAEAYASARDAWARLQPDHSPLIAGTVLPAFVPIASEIFAHRAAPLVHEPLAAAPELGDQERAVLAAIEPEMLALAPAIVVSTEATADAIARAAAVPRERIVVIAPPTPEYPRASGSAGAQTLILTPGARAASQEHETLFAALAGLGDLEWRLCIADRVAASADEARAVAALAAQFGIGGRMQLVPVADPAACEALWRQSDLFACTAARKGYGLCTAAAMKRGLPVAIVADSRTAPRIPPEAGATVSPGDSAQLAKALRRMIFDRDLRAAMAEAAWQAGKALPDSVAAAERLRSALR